jgi:CTP:molybdopterin cytidylyltransferase MocA
MLTEVLDRYLESGAPLVLSDYAGVTAPPFLYDRSLFAQIGDLPGHCDKRVIKRNRDRAVKVVWPASALDDVDEPTDFDVARQRLTPAEIVET